MHHAHRSIAIATVTLLTFIAASAPATARAQLEIGYAPNPYGFAATCDLARPLLSLNLDVRNTGDIPSKPRAIVVTDDTGAFHADDTLPPIAPNASTIYRVDIRYVPGGAGIAGTHRLSPVVGSHHVTPIEIVVPSSLCHATPAPVGLPSFGTNPSLSRGGANDVTRRIATVAVPVVGPLAYGNAARNTAGRLTLAIAPPTITRMSIAWRRAQHTRVWWDRSFAPTSLKRVTSFSSGIGKLRPGQHKSTATAFIGSTAVRERSRTRVRVRS